MSAAFGRCRSSQVFSGNFLTVSILLCRIIKELHLRRPVFDELCNTSLIALMDERMSGFAKPRR